MAAVMVGCLCGAFRYEFDRGKVNPELPGFRAECSYRETSAHPGTRWARNCPVSRAIRPG